MNPRFSILLPTRNGGAFLDGCIGSVLGQGYPSFELVVSDNANQDATPEVLASFREDPRLVVIRQERVLPVGENWSATLAASTGRYLLMIGDDDALLPGTLQALDELLTASGDPDGLSFDAFRYVAPGAVADRATSFYASPYFGYEPELILAGSLSQEMRRALVVDAYRFRFRFPLTMQLSLVSREALHRLPRGPFRSAFPDHYAVCGLLLTADRWQVTDRQLIVIGVSPKSFGHYFLNDEDDAGLDYLGVEAAFAGRLPGNQVLNAQCDWLVETKRDFDAMLEGIEIDRGMYVARQVRHWLRQYRHGTITRADARRRLRLLSARDVAQTLRTHAGPEQALAVVRAAAGLRHGRTVYLDRELTPLPDVGSITEFTGWLHARGLTPGGPSSGPRREAAPR